MSDFLYEDDLPPEGEYVELLRVAIDLMTPRQRFVITRLWGLDGQREHSLREVADCMGIAHQTVDEHSRAALKKIEATLTREGANPHT